MECTALFSSVIEYHKKISDIFCILSIDLAKKIQVLESLEGNDIDLVEEYNRVGSYEEFHAFALAAKAIYDDSMCTDEIDLLHKSVILQWSSKLKTITYQLQDVMNFMNNMEVVKEKYYDLFVAK